ncbi:MAG: chemotaxis protein CheW [Acetobacteraceae bacterium]
MDDLLADFLTETNESLSELDVALVTLEQTPDDAETLSLIFRLVHTIKGTCGFLGLPRLERVAHATENVLGKLRDGGLIVSPTIISQVLTALDRIKYIVAGLQNTAREPEGDDAPLIDALNVMAVGGAPPEPTSAEPPPAEPAPAEPVVAEPISTDAETSPVTPLQAEAPMTAANAGISPPPEATPPALAERDPAASALPARGVNASVPTPTAVPGSPPPGSASPGSASPGSASPISSAPAQTIRVTVDVLEDLMTLVSELVLARNQLLQLARNQENSAFAVPLQRLSHITSDLQEGVMKTRMQPIGNAWNKLPRLVRDLSQELGKKIELVQIGADTELDRQVLELIKDPLTHMVRNSGDHGLESPAERRASGKPETGRITLNAFHEGGHIILEVSDDGRGLPVDRIRAKVLANGLATEADLAGMNDAQIQRFIFRAGFSTAVQVSAVSGRGVGMDVVKTNIEKIGGTIDLKSTPGQGTTFIIKIPLTLAIVSALIVEAVGERFAIPQISVVELVRAQREFSHRDDGQANGTESVIERINDTPVLRLRDRLLPLVSLNGLLDLGDSETADTGAYIVVTQVGANLLGIIVDRVFDTEEIVVKPVAPILRNVTMFSGNTILGDGSVIMILDPNGIARATGVTTGGETRTTHSSMVDFQSTDARTAMLLFRAGGAQKMAVPLGLVARLEDIPRDKIETSCGAPVMQYRGKLMPLISMAGGIDPDRTRQPLLVFADGDRSMGLMVDEIIDVVEDRLEIELSGARPGMLGTAVIAGDATDILDTAYWLSQADQDWFIGTHSVRQHEGKRILVIEDNAFFRQLITPTLSAAGLDVVSVASAEEALRMRDGGAMFDAVVSDIEMPGMDGLTFARAVRSGGAWSGLPLIALSALDDAQQIEAGRIAGFNDYVPKQQRELLVPSLRNWLLEPVSA